MECKEFKLSKLTPDLFKCVIIVQQNKDPKIRFRILFKLEQDLEMTLQTIAE